jgi:hypothetical protein
MSGRASSTAAIELSRPWKSGTSTSTLASGSRARICRMVSANAHAPKSGRSSRSTDVSTTWRSCISAHASATRSGSAASNGSGRPVPTAQ